MFSKNPSKSVFLFAFILLILPALLVGCGQQSADSPAAAPAAVVDDAAPAAVEQEQAAAEQPASASVDADTVVLYQRTCLACHASGAAGAPRTGDKAAWQSRLDERGIDGLVDSAVNGMGSMPPKGLCSQCSNEDFKALILYMME